MSRRLTDRQTAVLAAVERLGRPAMADFWDAFPGLQPSAIKAVLDGLARKGLVESSGDPSQAYLGGVRWWSTAISPTSEDPGLTKLTQAVERANLGLRFDADPHERQLTPFLPLVEVEALLLGLPSAAIDRIRECLRALEEDGTPVRLSIGTEIASDPEPRLSVKLATTP